MQADQSLKPKDELCFLSLVHTYTTVIGPRCTPSNSYGIGLCVCLLQVYTLLIAFMTDQLALH